MIEGATKVGGSAALRLAHLGLLLVSALALLVGLTACDSAASTSSPPAAAVNGPSLSFKEMERDFGQIDYNNKMEYRWAFTNSGGAPLQVSDIKPEPLDTTS